MDGILDIQNDASESWDVASGTRNASSKIADIGLVWVHDSGTREWAFDKLTRLRKAGPSVAFRMLA
jgi:hypothetical protein